MRKLLTLVLVGLCIGANARQITPDEAISVASDFMSSSDLQTATSAKSALRPMKAPGVDTNSGSSPYYVFNRGENDGFVIISGDDRAPKILGYSDKGSFDSENLPPQLKAMMENFEEKLKNLPKDASVHSSWNTRSDAKEIVRLNTALWNQFEPYNLLAPEFDGERGPIGCVATALAIIMKYHNYPSKAIKELEHKWYCEDRSYTYNFGSMNIDYSLLKDEYLPDENLSLAEEQAISELFYASAAALNMQFGAYSSSATEQDKPRVYKEIFGFDENCQYINRECFEEGEWNSIIKDQLNNHMPILYSARSDYDGHAFVLDGYDSEGNYHVNWGWGGYENGYYSIDGLLDFEKKHGMTIYMRPGQEPEKYSEKYSRQWIDNGSVLGPAMGDTGGICLNVEDIEKDIPFSATVGYLFTPFDFNGEGTIALLDKDNKIVELAKGSPATIRFDAYVDEGWQQFGRDWNPCGIPTFYDIYFSNEVKEGYSIAYVTKEDGEDIWKIVPSTLDATNLLSCKGNIPVVGKVNFYVHGDESKVSFEQPKDSYMYGESCPLNIQVVDGVATVYIDGILSHHATSYHPLAGNLVMENHDYNIDIYYKTRDQLISRSYEVINPGALPEMIAEEDKDKIGSIKISGKINTKDIEAAGDLPYLLNIDLEDAEFVGDEFNRDDFFPRFALYVYERPFCPPFESIKLPKKLKGFEQISLNCYSMEAIDIPATVEEYEYGCLSAAPKYSALSFVNVRNPIPGKLDDGLIKPFSYAPNELVLFVPEGSKSAYESDELWRSKFKEIIEVSEDAPYIGEYVEDDNARYLILSNCAAIVGFKGKKDVDKVKEFVEYEGKMYPVKYVVNNKLNAPKNIIAPSTENFKWNFTDIKTIYSTSIKNLEGFNFHGTHFVPGSSFSYEIYGVEEMYEYKINKDKGLLSISSDREEVKIDSVIINGEKAEKNENNIYIYDPSSVPEVCVEYTLFGEYPVKTVYDREFNSNLVNSSFVQSVESIILTPDNWSGIEGDTFKIEATVLPENATDKALTWNSSDETVATVDLEGNVKTHAHGEALITAMSVDGSEISATCTVSVAPRIISVESVTISQTSAELRVGESVSLAATIYPEDATDKTVIWSSDNASIASVDENGNVVAVSLGSAVITATCGNAVAYCTVLVVATPAESITLSQTEAQLKVGESMSLSATVYPEDVTDKTVIWSSDNASVASVDENGNVVAVSLGSAVITATCGNVSASCAVTVVATLVETIQLSPDDWNGEEGATFRIEATVLPENATDKSLVWSSSDESVATVDNEGSVSVLKEGVCVITASAADGSGIFAECVITSVSGVDSIFSADDSFDIYGLNGILIKKDSDRESLKHLTPGIYLIRQNNQIKKIIIR